MQHVSFAPHGVTNSLGGMASESPAYGEAKCLSKISAVHGQEELSLAISGLQTVIIEGLMRRLTPVLNADPDGILKSVEAYFSQTAAKDDAQRGVSEVNRRTMRQTHEVTALTVMLNSVLEQLDLP